MAVLLVVLGGLCMVVNAVRLRRRLSALDRLGPDGVARDGYVVLTADGTEVPMRVRHAAEAYAYDNGLDMVDLVPATLPMDQALDLVRHVDVRAYHRDWFGMGRGVGYALVVSKQALAAAGYAASTSLDPAELGEATARLRFYVERAGLVVADIPAADRVGQRRAFMRSQTLVAPGSLALSQTLAATAAGYLLVVAALIADPLAGACLAVLYSLLPCLVFCGRTVAVSPRDLRGVVPTRMLYTPWSIVRTLCAPHTRWERARIDEREQARLWYRTQIDKGVERFLQPRRDDCPWCGSPYLRRHVTCRDLLQGKPGRFTLERCTDCGHLFQNPRLTQEGLAFYYKDAYDGLGDAAAEWILSSTTPAYRARARMASEHTQPHRWLDIGTGRAHFCRVARTELPSTRFDGLDQSTAIEDATARGWIDHGYRGSFLGHVTKLAGTYDLLSMFHYLEHTLDPLAELDAAITILPPGGHLLIELPDPDCLFAKLLRGLWVPYLAPQHLHLIPAPNLRSALENRGLRIVAEHRREADQAPDMVTSAAGLVNRMGLDVDRPWWPNTPSYREYTRVGITLALAGPLMALAITADLLTYPVARTTSNAYRILAQKPTDGEADALRRSCGSGGDRT